MKFSRFFAVILGAVLLLPSACQTKDGNTDSTTSDFVTIKDGEFYIGDSLYRYLGTNFWYATILASPGKGGNRERLARELDTLQSLGINNLRILVGGDGKEGLPSHISPTLQSTPGVYNPELLEGLDYLLADLEKRGMKAVLYLNNSWEWSGGYSTYLEWAGEGEAKIPSIDGYQAYVDYASKFVLSDSAKNMASRHVKEIVSRTNSITGKPYSESPAIMAWQIANEPRCFNPANKEQLADWLLSTAQLIKSIDANHLVSTGSEGEVGCERDMELWSRIHTYPEIDYATIHIWPYNWSWVTAATLNDSIAAACRNTSDYINSHYEALQKSLQQRGLSAKPIVIEEFGYPRDNMSISLSGSVAGRDAYYDHVFSEVEDGKKIKGVNFWGWGGLANPIHEMWQPGDDYTGDPAQEPQGLYSVFAGDSTTIAIIKRYSKK